jgi:hypothetical protein
MFTTPSMAMKATLLRSLMKVMPTLDTELEELEAMELVDLDSEDPDSEDPVLVVNLLPL